MSVRLRIGLIPLILFGLSAGATGLRANGKAAVAAGNVPGAAPQTIIAVTTTDDDFAPANGTCSLREAVYAAVHDTPVDSCPAGSASDTLVIPAGTYMLTRIGTNDDSGFTGDLDITGTLRLTGATSATTIIDAANDDRSIEIFAGQVALENLTLRNGRGVWGGAVRLHSGELTVSESTIANNIAVAVDGITYGGGILNQAGTLTVTHSLMDLNSVVNEYMGTSGSGGAIHTGADARTAIIASTISRSIGYYRITAVTNDGALTVSDSLFDGNTHAIFNRGDALIERSRFFSHKAPAIYNSEGALTINASEIASTTIANNLFYCADGGAIATIFGTLTLRDSYLHDNLAHYGAGLHAYRSQVEISGSAINGNAAQAGETGRETCGGLGGGIYANHATMQVENTTVSANQARSSAAGVAAEASQVELINSTVATNYNELYEPEPGEHYPDGAGLFNIDATNVFSLTNTLLARNTSRLAPGGADCRGAIKSLGYNLIGAPTANCAIIGDLTGTQIGVDPLLGTLASHGGATPNWDLHPQSPAIDAGSPGDLLGSCPPIDQRGLPRPADGDGVGGPRCDIGAYERQPGDLEPPTMTPTPPTATPTPTASPTAMPSATPPTASPTAAQEPTTTPTASASATPGDAVAPGVYFPLVLR